VFIPLNPAAAGPGLDAAAIRAQGFATVASLDPVADPEAEAARLGCTHVLTESGLVALSAE
jgi:ATP phosphoribosyltransferase regulatory subunit